MSSALTAAAGYCEIQDVQEALQETDMKMGEQPFQDAQVEAAIIGASQWFAGRANAHFYDSGGTASDLIATDTESATGSILDVPASPHRQDGQLFHAAERSRTQITYPNTQVGRYVRVTLPYRDVQEVTRLDVREYGGDVTDWVASADFAVGRGEDYYLQVDGDDEYGRSYLYLDAGSIGPRKDFDELLTVDMTYGRDWQTDAWAGVRRGIATLAAAQLVAEDNVLAQVPENGQLVGVDTQADHLLYQALGYPGEASDPVGGYLSPWLTTPVA